MAPLSHRRPVKLVWSHRSAAMMMNITHGFISATTARADLKGVDRARAPTKIISKTIFLLQYRIRGLNIYDIVIKIAFEIYIIYTMMINNRIWNFYIYKIPPPPLPPHPLPPPHPHPSRASHVVRHDRKSVASHSLNVYLVQTFAESDR